MNEKQLENGTPSPQNNSISPVLSLDSESSTGGLCCTQLFHPVQEHVYAQRLFKFLQILSACFGGFAQGGNDVRLGIFVVVG
jgi:phosphate/sulfate permease